MPEKKRSPGSPFGPLAGLMEDPSVDKIMVDAPNRVLIAREGRIELTDVSFVSEAVLRSTIDDVLALGGAKFQPGRTVCETRLDGKASVVAILPPTASTGPSLVIHKAFVDSMTIRKLIEYRSVSEEMIDLLRSALLNRLNILVTGDASAGKMTVVNVLTGEIPQDERVIVVEAAPELQARAKWQVCLNSETTGELSFTDLINVATKMRPDRLVFGEVKGPEAMRILQVMSSGHDGCLLPIHATSPEDALNRLEAFCLMSNLGLGLEEIRILIASSINLITVQHRLPDGSRKITDIVELRGLDQDRYLLQPLMRYDPETDRFERLPAKPGWDTELR